jgi:replicative DNA helicase
MKKLITKTDEENKGKKPILTTGFFDLDRKLRGLNPGELVILAARPGMGKTTLMLNFAYNIAKELKKSACIFSLEMQQTELSLKLASIIHKNEPDVKLLCSSEKSSLQTERVMNMLKTAEKNLEDTRLFIIDNGGVSLNDIRREAKKLKKKNDLSILFIDYLQLIKIQSKLQNRNLEIQEITQGLKMLAKELEIPILLLSQLSRDTEKRSEKKPVLSDLRDSGAIEQDADIVLFVYRENYYKKEEQEEENTEIIIAKNRKGKTGVVNLIFYPEKSVFENFNQ